MWWMLVGLALADVDAEDRWLGNDNLAIGFDADGSLVNSDMELGILWDPDGPEGEIPTGGDMIRVGYHWELWTWSYESGGDDFEGTNLGPHSDSDMSMEWEGPWLTDTIHGLRASGGDDNISVDIAMAVSQEADVMWTDFTITALSDVEDLWLGRVYDPDQDYWATETYSTYNTSGDGYGAATGDYDDRAIVLLGIGPEGLGVGGVCDWCRTNEGILDGAGESNYADDDPGVAVEVGSLLAGESTSVRFVYGFGLGEGATLSMSFAWLTEDDMDGDGSPVPDDCDDWDASVSPDTEEIADDLDNDCDGEIDEDTVISDDDGDGWTELDGDCDDDNPSVYPGADPVDGVMNADCDGEADSGWWPEDTGAPEDTGEPEDTGDDDQTVGSDTMEDTGEPGELADDNDKKDNSACGCSTQPGPGSGLGMLSLTLLVLARRRRDGCAA